MRKTSKAKAGEKCTWHSPTEATLTVGNREIEISLSRPMDPRDLPWLYRGVFEYKQLYLKGQTSSTFDDPQIAVA